MTGKGSDQTARMRTLNWGFAGRTYHIIGKLVHWLNYVFSKSTYLFLLVPYCTSHIVQSSEKFFPDSAISTKETNWHGQVQKYTFITRKANLNLWYKTRCLVSQSRCHITTPSVILIFRYGICIDFSIMKLDGETLIHLGFIKRWFVFRSNTLCHLKIPRHAKR